MFFVVACRGDLIGQQAEDVHDDDYEREPEDDDWQNDPENWKIIAYKLNSVQNCVKCNK